MKKILIVILCMVLVVALGGCGAPAQQSTGKSLAEGTNGEMGKEGEPVSTTAMESVEIEQKKAFDITVSVPVEAEIQEGDGEIIFSIYNNEDSLVYDNRIVADVFSDVSSYDDLKNGVADTLWGNWIGSAEAANEKNEEIIIGDTPLLHYSGEAMADSNQTYILDLISFWINNKTYIVTTRINKSYEEEYRSLRDEYISTMELDVRPPDILTDSERRRNIKSMNKNLQYEDLLALVNTYIAENTPAETDPVFSIKESTESILAILPEYEVVTDEFDGNTVIYGGINEITSDVNFVPYISPDNTLTSYIYAKVGFKQNGWLFFDKVKIKIGDDDYIEDSFGYGDTIRDVISGGTIKEEGDMSISIERAGELLNAESPVIRFEGEDDKTRDHTMTESEISALNKIYQLSNLRNVIDTVIEEWESANG